MNSILISIKPKWAAKILNGDKTAEIRRTAPKNWKDYLSGKTKVKPEPMTGYIYCTKTIKPLSNYDWGDFTFEDLPKLGKVVACFTLNEIEEICFAPFGDELSEEEERLCSESCLSVGELVGYLRDGMFGYAYHISDLQIFDEPMELAEFSPYRKYGIGDYFEGNETEYLTLDEIDKALFPKPLAKAPYSWCYVEVNKK